MTSKLANYLALTKAGHFCGAESELAEDLVGMLAEVGCVPPQLGFGARESRRRSHPANPPGLGMLVFEKRFVRDELRIGPDSVEVVDRPAWNVGGLDTLEPICGRLRGKKSDEALDRSLHALGPRLVALEPFRMTDGFQNRRPMLVSQRRDRDEL